MAKPQAVRVRFAPSPTGDPHVGSIWAAQFNWLFARQHDGQFILRIEDTDRARLVAGATEKIFEALGWYGLTPDEGPQQGGPFAPYVQSQRLPLYQEHARQLVEQGSAYYCFCTAERLAQLRAQQTADKRPPKYDKRCAAIPKSEAMARVAAGEPAVIRLNLPTSGQIVHQDIIRRTVIFAYDQLDDSILLKTDGFPTYHLANVVDDHVMEISHVIRAEEWLPSVPKHVFLHRAFGWEPPQFAHLPLILGSDKSKLSKRHGATSALSFRDQGYLPEAMRNFLVLMGWHPKDDREILSVAEVLQRFKLEDVNPAGAIFDRTKLDWMNGEYIRKLPARDLFDRLRGFWHLPPGEAPSEAWKMRVIALAKDRLKKLSTIDEFVNFTLPSVWNDEVQTFDRSWLRAERGRGVPPEDELRWMRQLLEKLPEPWDVSELKTTVLGEIKNASKKNLDVLWPLRVALTLRKASPDVFDVLTVLGKSESLRRIEFFLGEH